jgi:hypothetical protein
MYQGRTICVFHDVTNYNTNCKMELQSKRSSATQNMLSYPTTLACSDVVNK